METGKLRFSFMQVYRNLSERYPYSQKHKIEYEEGCPVRGSLLAIARRTHVISICIRRLYVAGVCRKRQGIFKKAGDFSQNDSIQKRTPESLLKSFIVVFKKLSRLFGDLGELG